MGEGHRTVTAGETEYTIKKFKGFKALRLGRMLTSLGEIGPKVSEAVNKYVSDYRTQNVEKISRAALELRYPAEAAGVSDKAWEESDGYIELPNDPTEAEVLAVILPKAFELAGDSIVDLLAWVVADDAKLEEADNQSEEAVKEYIESIRKNLLYKADLDELLELAYGAQEVLSEQMAGKGQRAKALLKLVGLDQETEEPEGDQEKKEGTEGDQKKEKPTAEKPKDETHSTQESPTMSPRPDSSTDSPPPTGGGGETSSTDRAGERSASISG